MTQQEQWQETTLRKGKNKICRDMFITDSRGTWQFVSVKNGRISSKHVITAEEAKKLIADNNLVKTNCGTFKGCRTYRTEQSTRLVDRLLNLG